VNHAPAAALQIKLLDRAAQPAWDAFVAACPEATFFHRAGWKEVVERSFGHAAPFLYAEQGGRIRGVMPLVHVKSLLFGRSLVSSAFAVYGGAAADGEEARAALEARAVAMADELGVDHLELRHRERRHPDWPCKSDLYVTFRRAIGPDHDRNMNAIPRKQRAMVRKGIANGLVGVEDPDPDRLHHIYAVSVRNLGTPVFPRAYFRNLMQAFGPDCDVLTVMAGDEAVASVMNFRFRDEVLPYYGGGTEKARAVAANDFMYWEVMRRAAERGCRVFDYGRSKVGTGSYSFKKNWGFEPTPLHYEFKLRKGDAIPDVNPLNPKYRLFIETWKRLPLPVAKALGPFVVRGLG